jgi:hypothetical protein
MPALVPQAARGAIGLVRGAVAARLACGTGRAVAAVLVVEDDQTNAVLAGPLLSRRNQSDAKMGARADATVGRSVRESRRSVPGRPVEQLLGDDEADLLGVEVSPVAPSSQQAPSACSASRPDRRLVDCWTWTLVVAESPVGGKVNA